MSRMDGMPAKAGAESGRCPKTTKSRPPPQFPQDLSTDPLRSIPGSKTQKTTAQNRSESPIFTSKISYLTLISVATLRIFRDLKAFSFIRDIAKL